MPINDHHHLLLKQIAASRLPLLVSGRKEVAAVLALRAAGLLIAVLPEDRGPVQVLTVTQKGTEALQQIVYPAHGTPRQSGSLELLRSKLSWMTGASRRPAQGLNA